MRSVAADLGRVWFRPMSYGVVCIARVGGSVGTEVGTQVAEALGYRLVDEEIVQRAAEIQGVAVEELEEVEKRKGFFQRMLESLAVGGAADGFATGMAVLPTAPSLIDPQGLRGRIQQSIHETADQGGVVIVSHAASFALADRPDVLRVLVTASHGTRVARLAEHLTDAKVAEKAVSDDDAGRAHYLKQFYGVDHELSTHYDLVINSDRLDAARIADLVVRAAAN